MNEKRQISKDVEIKYIGFDKRDVLFVPRHNSCMLHITHVAFIQASTIFNGSATTYT